MQARHYNVPMGFALIEGLPPALGAPANAAGSSTQGNGAVAHYVSGASIVVDGGLGLTNWFDPPDLD